MIARQLRERELSPTGFAVFVVWLFHVSAIIGITLGFEQWFVTKTPLNLTVITVLFCLAYPMNNRKYLALGLVFFLAGMTAEWIGIHYDWLFGKYYYGDNLGWKFQGVPYLIGINWMILVFITGGVMERLTNNRTLRVIGGMLHEEIEEDHQSCTA
ncbi:MAG: carotenoid biosynthesis protein, partial [Bacteroidota bacterium]